MLVCVARHPFRTWLTAWLALTCVWLLVQVYVGVPWGSLTPKPPARSQIRYADLEGRRTEGGIVMRFPEAVLAADPAFSPFRLHADLQFGDHDGKAVATLQTLTKFECGWPLALFTGRLWSAWDVTDPERDYVPAGGIFPRPQRGSESAGLAWMSEDGAKSLRLHLQRAGVWSPVAIAALPIAPVFGLWIVYRWRQRRRSVRGACLTCGHARAPGAVSQRCPECGIPFDAVSPSAEVSRLRRMICAVRLPAAALLLWLTFTSAAFAAFWFTSCEHLIDEGKIRETAEWHADDARQKGLTTPGETGLRASKRQIGWPWPILTIEQWRSYEVNLDATYVPVPVDPDIEFRDEHPLWDWYWIGDDPFILNWWFVNWRPGVLILAVTAFAAGNFLCAIQLMWWSQRARNARRC